MTTQSMPSSSADARPQLETIRARNNVVLSDSGRIIDPDQDFWTGQLAASGGVVPVAFDLGSGAPLELEVTLGGGLPAGKDAVLRALDDDGQVLFSGTTTADKTVTVKSQIPVREIAKLGIHELHWQLATGSQEITNLGATAVDFHWPSLTNVPAAVVAKGVPVEMLKKVSEGRRLALEALGDSDAAAENVAPPAVYSVAYLVQTIFGFTPPVYDRVSGAPHFVSFGPGQWNAITLNYSAYCWAHANTPGSVLNCYDAAAVLQSTLRHNGYVAQYCYMSPYGYIKLTNLIGYGQCNSPFGGALVVGQTAQARTGFGNHAFVGLPATGTVADSCAGPHVGNETPGTYVGNAVDPVHYNPPAVATGTTANIGYYYGVISVTSLNSLREAPAGSEKLAAIANYSPSLVEATASTAVAGKWPDPSQCPALQGEWTTGYEEVVPGEEECVKIWMLKNADKLLMVKAYVSSTDNALAFNRFLSIGSTSQHAEPIFVTGPAGIGHCCVRTNTAENRMYLWVYHNAVLEIFSTDAEADIAGLGEWFYRWAQDHLTGELPAQLPRTELDHSTLSPKVTDRFRVSVAGPQPLRLDLLAQSESARLVSQTGDSLAFSFKQAADCDLNLVVIDPERLLVKATSLRVNVVE